MIPTLDHLPTLEAMEVAARKRDAREEGLSPDFQDRPSQAFMGSKPLCSASKHSKALQSASRRLDPWASQETRRLQQMLNEDRSRLAEMQRNAAMQLYGTQGCGPTGRPFSVFPGAHVYSRS